jgi:hypothetical protein
MKNDFNLAFLRNKIEETRTALCTFHHPAFPNQSYIIQSTGVDDDGCIAFNFLDSLSTISRFDLKSFAVKFLYYKKGLGYYLNIEALANIIMPYNIPDGERIFLNTEDGTIIIKAKILSAEYNEGKREFSHGRQFSVKKKLAQIAAGLFWM